MTIVWTDVTVPDFRVTNPPADLPDHLYARRRRDAYSRAGCDWLVVYGDREHFANLAYLTRFDPRFEEALLLLGAGDVSILIVGNEGLGYTPLADPALRIELCQSLSLMGQRRDRAPKLADVLQQAGIRRGQTVGLGGWKYLEGEEATGDLTGFFAPAVLVDSLRRIVGDPAGVVEATPVLMHPVEGMRAHNEAEQIAAFEWAASRATWAVWRIVHGTCPGMTEYQAVSQMGYEGDPLSAHVMFASGKEPIIGLRSPRSRRIERGDGVSTAVSYWGGLGCRAGLVDDSGEEFRVRIAIPYFQGLVAWYKAARIGASGGDLYQTVCEALASGGLQPALNPGHLMSFDEWVHTPIRPGSGERIASGMAFQSDIIPEPLPAGWAVNCEDPLVFADSELRQDLGKKFPAVWERIQARQEFMRDELGIPVSDDLLPLSTAPACLPPLWLAAEKLLRVG